MVLHEAAIIYGDLNEIFIVSAAFEHLRNNIEELDGKVEVDETDLIFLKGLMDSPVLQNLVKVRNQ